MPGDEARSISGHLNHWGDFTDRTRVFFEFSAREPRKQRMIRFVTRWFGASRRPAAEFVDPAAEIADLARRNAELEQMLLAQRDAAEELRRSQADLHRAQRLARIGNWRWSISNAKLIDFSESFAEIHGVAPSEIASYIEADPARVLHADDRDRVMRALRQYDEAGANFEIEYRIVRPDGRVRHIREIGECILDERGHPTEQMGTVQDVTELKHAEDALRRAHDELEQRVRTRTEELLDLNAALRREVAERERAEAEGEKREILLRSAARISKVGYGVWDEQKHKYVDVSKEFADIAGVTLDEFGNRYPTEVEDFEAIHPEDRERYRAYEESYNANPAITQIEYRMANVRGEIVHVRECMEPVWDASGRLVQSIITNQEITEQKQTEEQLRQAQKMEAVGQLTGGIAHDFNNLLAVIIGNLELLKGELESNEQASDWVETAIAAAERGAGLTQRLLAFSRKQALRPVPVDANSLVMSMLDLLRRTLGEQIEIELVSQVKLWPCLVDPNQLENAILNLAINARDAMLDGGKLTITTSNAWVDEEAARAQADLSPGPYVLIEVSDTGRGMPEEVQRRAFEPFYTTKDIGRGSGLGLSMVYGFIKQSGGHVNVDSELGVGTTIRLYLARHSGDERLEDAATASPELLKAKGQRILVVEDDTDLRAMVVRMLESLGYEALDTSSGPAALEILRSPVEIDLLLTDVVLPKEMNGIELAEAARRQRTDLRVLYMSGYTEDEILRRGHLADRAGFLQKPFRMIEVARAVQNALAGNPPAR